MTASNRADRRKAAKTKYVAAMRYVWGAEEVADMAADEVDPIDEVLNTINLHLRALLADGNDVLGEAVILIGRPPGMPEGTLGVETKAPKRLAGAAPVALDAFGVVAKGEPLPEEPA